MRQIASGHFYFTQRSRSPVAVLGGINISGAKRAKIRVELFALRTFRDLRLRNIIVGTILRKGVFLFAFLA
ncbi:MAG: hypothetical protein M1470_13040 [Bacteroidetes bacterium]|nr:hypothetical protein [Bacteroidota bacterium]MCL5739077.1 hypothetical protein [Bacteroidota bacterium]